MMTRFGMFFCTLGAASVLAACGGADAPSPGEERDAAVEPPAAEAPNGPTGAAPDPNARTESPPRDPAAPPEQTDPFADFDLARARAAAEALLGVPEDAVEPSRQVRIVRRGEEHFPATMDLRPGRLNVELDARDGRYVVSRVGIETPEGTEVVE